MGHPVPVPAGFRAKNPELELNIPSRDITSKEIWILNDKLIKEHAIYGQNIFLSIKFYARSPSALNSVKLCGVDYKTWFFFTIFGDDFLNSLVKN